MRRALAAILICLLCAPLVQASGEAIRPIRIGVFEPLTGASAEGGQMEYEGIIVANALVPEVLGRPIELVVVDNQSEEPGAVSAAKKLVDTFDVDIVLGSWGSSVSMAAQPIFEAAQTPAIGTSCTNPLITLGNEYYFRVCYVDDFQGKLLADYAKNTLGAETAAIIRDISSAYAVGLCKYFKETFGDENIVAEAFFNAGDNNFAPKIKAVMAVEPDIIFVPASYIESAYLMRQAHGLGFEDALFLGADTWETDALVEIGGVGAEGCLFTTFYDLHAAPTPESEAFLAKYRDMFGRNPKGAVTALGYDAYMVAVKAIEAAGSTDGPALRDALAGITYEGVTDTITFDENGDAIKKRAVIMTVQNGSFTYVDTVVVEQ